MRSAFPAARRLASALCVFLLLAAAALAAPKFQAVMMAGNYPGGETFDDFLQPSFQALANNLSLWSNWDIAGPNKNISLLPGTNPGGGVSDAQRYINAMKPYQATGAKALGAGDYFYLFYFGHGTFGRVPGEMPGEVAPALTVWDEALSFPDHTYLTDDTLKSEFNKFAPGVGKIFVNISCFSGGFWNGNDTVGGGDLEQLAATALMASSPENRVTYAGGLGPRPWEPLYLRNLIFTAHPLFWFQNGIASPTLAQWHNVSRVAGTVANANRFVDPFESQEGMTSDWWNELFSGTVEQTDLSLYDPGDLFNDWWGPGVPEPASAMLMMVGLGATSFVRRRRM